MKSVLNLTFTVDGIMDD